MILRGLLNTAIQVQILQKLIFIRKTARKVGQRTVGAPISPRPHEYNANIILHIEISD